MLINEREGMTCKIQDGQPAQYHITGAMYWEDGSVTMTTNCWRCGKRYETQQVQDVTVSPDCGRAGNETRQPYRLIDHGLTAADKSVEYSRPDAGE